MRSGHPMRPAFFAIAGIHPLEGVGHLVADEASQAIPGFIASVETRGSAR